jgi:N-acetylneuraminic acid mutarotase
MKCPVLLDHYKYGPVSDLETTQITQVTTFLSTTFKQINTIPLQGGLDQQHFSLYYSGLKNPYLVIDSLRMKLEKILDLDHPICPCVAITHNRRQYFKGTL